MPPINYSTLMNQNALNQGGSTGIGFSQAGLTDLAAKGYDWGQASQQAAMGGVTNVNGSPTSALGTSGVSDLANQQAGQGGTGREGRGQGGTSMSGGGNLQDLNSGNYGAGNPGQGNDWWSVGNVGDYGAYNALQDPRTFGLAYSNRNLGANSISGQGEFLGQFDPMSLAMIFNGSKDFMDPGNRLAGANSVLNAITGGKNGVGGFLSPSVIGSDLINLASKPFDQSGKAGGPINPLQAALQDPDPQTQMSNTVSILGNALAGVVPQQSLSAYMSVIKLLGEEWMTGPDVLKGGTAGGGATGQIGPGGKNNFMSFLASRLGPNLGL